MGGVDAIVFTGGIGEHDADSRAKICHHMDWLGIRIDTDKNRDAHKQKKDVVEVTAWGARVRTLIIETNEELMIARDTKEVLEEVSLTFLERKVSKRTFNIFSRKRVLARGCSMGFDLVRQPLFMV